MYERIPDSKLIDFREFINRLSEKYVIDASVEFNEDKKGVAQAGGGIIYMNVYNYAYSLGYYEYATVAWAWRQNGFRLRSDEFDNGFWVSGMTGDKGLWALALHEFTHLMVPYGTHHRKKYQNKLYQMIKYNPFSTWKVDPLEIERTKLLSNPKLAQFFK